MDDNTEDDVSERRVVFAEDYGVIADARIVIVNGERKVIGTDNTEALRRALDAEGDR